MRTISLWAYHHKWAARSLLLFLYTLLNSVAFFFAEVLVIEQVSIPFFLPYLVSIPFVLGIIFYPSRKQKSSYKNFYVFQKTLDSVLITTSFLLIVFTANGFLKNNNGFNFSYLTAAEVMEKPKKPFSKIKVQVKQASFFVKHWKDIKENYRLLRKAYSETSKGTKVVLIILFSLIAAGLLILIAGLSCNLSCSGNEGAALLVLLLGTGLIIFLLAKVIQAINRGTKRKEAVSSASKA